MPNAPDLEVPPRRRRAVRIAVSGLLAVSVFIAVTGFTGLSGPGPLRRFPYRDLRALADRINTQAGDFRTPDDCWRLLADRTGPLRDIARVDYVRSRVVVRLYARAAGVVDRGTRTVAMREIGDLLATGPGGSWAMVETEASPDGWSPTVSCRAATRGRVTDP